MRSNGKLPWRRERERTGDGGRASSKVLNTGSRPVDAWKRHGEHTSTCVPGYVSVSIADTLIAAVYLLGVRNISPQTIDNSGQAGRKHQRLRTPTSFGEKRKESTVLRFALL